MLKEEILYNKIEKKFICTNIGWEKKMHRLMVFDLDGTLALAGEAMLRKDVNKLIELEQMGYTIVICSGKSSYYLCGFARQLGLKEPILVGENGATLQFGIELPPKHYEEHPYSVRAKEQREMMRQLIDERYGNKIWYQPNEVGLSAFPREEEIFEELQLLIDEKKEYLDELIIYRHFDCFDFVPKNINKQSGLRHLIKILNLEAREIVAVGDGVNDIPMFEFADVAIGIIGESIDNRIEAAKKLGVDYTFKDIGQVLDFIIANNL